MYCKICLEAFTTDTRTNKQEIMSNFVIGTDNFKKEEVILACGGKPCIEILKPGTRVKIKYNQYWTANAFPTGHGGPTATGIDWTTEISTGRGPAVQNNYVHCIIV
jgi:hypothetical protein